MNSHPKKPLLLFTNNFDVFLTTTEKKIEEKYLD